MRIRIIGPLETYPFRQGVHLGDVSVVAVLLFAHSLLFFSMICFQFEKEFTSPAGYSYTCIVAAWKHQSVIQIFQSIYLTL